MTSHQEKQKEVIDKIAEQVESNSLSFQTVAPVEDFESDPRICLTSVFFPSQDLLDTITQSLIEPLRKIEPAFYYYPQDSLHMTIKNIRVVNNPPHFDEKDILIAQEIFASVIPTHKRFNVYFYRLLLFPNSLALIGTTDPELDTIILDIDKKLAEANISDDKVYVNSQYFFSNMTLVRFGASPSEEFVRKVTELSDSINFAPVVVDSVQLISCNAAIKMCRKIGTWRLK